MTELSENNTMHEKTTHMSHAEISPGLWIGSLAAVRHIVADDEVSQQWTVISILDSEKLIRLTKLLLAKSKNIVHHEVWRLEDRGSADFMSDQLVSILEVIDQALPTSEMPNKACLVHCAQGVSRSASTCAAWYMSRKQYSLTAALEVIRCVRPQTQPNIGFIAYLRALEKRHGNLQDAMVRMGKKHDTLENSCC